MTGATRGWIAGLLLASPAASVQTAFAQTYPPAYQPEMWRFVAGFVGGSAQGNVSASNARGASQHGSALTEGFVVEYERRLFRNFSLAASSSFSFWYWSAADDAGYRNMRLDLGVVPRLELLRVKQPTWLGEFYLALPVGLSEPFASAPDRRAFTETVDRRLGWYAGGAVGVTFLFPRWGFRVESCYCRHQYGSRTTITPNDPAQPTLIDDATLVDDQLLFTFAGVFAF